MNISGVVVDEKSGEGLDDIEIEIQLLQRRGMLKPGQYVTYQTTTSENGGRFSFSIPKGSNAQIVVGKIISSEIGGIEVLGEVEEEISDIRLQVRPVWKH